MNLAGRFIIDGYDLYEAFKVVVQEAQGLDVLPKVKKRTEYDWPEESGVDVDATTDLTYEAHDITLDCYVQESTYADAVKRINGVVKLLSSDGYHLLGSQLRQRLYPVLLQEVTGYKRITPASASAIYVQFTLKLRCPLPETRIGNATVEASGQVTVVVPTGKDFIVWWGDGTVNENTLTHTYTEAGTYTVLIAGTGVTSVVITGINIAEFSYPATGDITHVDVSHTSEEAYQRAVSIESGLKSEANGGSVPTSLYSWFKGLFPSLVDGSVKSWIVGIVTQLKWLTDNIGGAGGGYVLNYIVPANTNLINLTVDKNGQPFNFVEGDTIIIVLKMTATMGNVVTIRVNNLTTSIYRSSNALQTGWSIGTGASAHGTEIRLTLVNNELIGGYVNSSESGTSYYSNMSALKTLGLNSALTSIQILISAYQFNAGSQIIIKKV